MVLQLQHALAQAAEVVAEIEHFRCGSVGRVTHAARLSKSAASPWIASINSEGDTSTTRAR